MKNLLNKSADSLLTNSSSEVLLYVTSNGEMKLEVKLENETVWLSQAQMADLFGKDRDTVSEHIQNIFKEKELEEIAVTRNFRATAKDGKTYQTKFYNLDVIIPVGYRVKSHRGTQFRIWATKQLKEYIIKGFVMDDVLLAKGQTVSKINYFDELLERVRAIRVSEKNLYTKVKDIFATSIDYSSKTDDAKEFYAVVQNKFHYAVTGETAAEIVVHRIDSNKSNLGLTNWKKEKPTSDDARIAKNYMLEKELKILFLLVEQFLSFAELQIQLERPMYMKDWKARLDSFIQFNNLDVLQHKGTISHEEMKKVVHRELQEYLRLPEFKNPH